MLELRPNCECCDRDLPPDSWDARIFTYVRFWGGGGERAEKAGGPGANTNFRFGQSPKPICY